MPHSVAIRRAGWFRATHGAVLCLIVLASVRSLVPGLCATLAATKDSARAAVPACCAARLAAEDAKPAYRAESTGREHAPCAFCYLVMGLGQANPMPPVVLAVDAAALSPVAATPSPRLAGSNSRHPSRAPPAKA